MITIKHETSSPFAKQIDDFVIGTFPTRFERNSTEVVDRITDAIIATNKIRYGAKPPVESIVKMRDVIRYWVNRNEPVPFMIPWGSEKPDGTSIDVAELCALKTLRCLHDRVAEHYQPSVLFNLRIEDQSAPFLFYDRIEEARKQAEQYTQDLTKLIRVLGAGFITARPESMLVTESDFNRTAHRFVGMFEGSIQSVLLNGKLDENELKTLSSNGWKGAIKIETVNFYLGQYTKLYPFATTLDKVHRLARYYSSALARSILRIRGDLPSWEGNYLELSFVEAPPGTEVYFSRRVLYRTIPCDFTTNHIPPWRAKGYLAIGEDAVCPKVTSYNKLPNLEEHKVTLSDGIEEIDIRSDLFLVQ